MSNTGRPGHPDTPELVPVSGSNAQGGLGDRGSGAEATMGAPASSATPPGGEAKADPPPPHPSKADMSKMLDAFVRLPGR